jgi:predicted ABC-type exoprotein transport system permease subunit
LRRGTSRLITLHLMLLVSVVAFNLIITSVSFRYMYSIIPLWILLGVHGVSVFARWTASQTKSFSYYTLRWIAAVVVLISFAPWRVINSYDEKIL